MTERRNLVAFATKRPTLRPRSDRVGRDTESRMVVHALVGMGWSPGHETRPRLSAPRRERRISTERRNLVAFATKRPTLRPRSDRAGRDTEARHLRTAKHARAEHRHPTINAPAPRSTAARSYRIVSSWCRLRPDSVDGGPRAATDPPRRRPQISRPACDRG